MEPPRDQPNWLQRIRESLAGRPPEPPPGTPPPDGGQPPPSPNPRSPEDFLGKEELAKEIKRLMENITPGHVAREITEGQLVSEQSIQEVPGLDEAMAVIALAPDSATTHNREWLRSQHNRLSQILRNYRDSFATLEDFEAATGMLRRIESQLNAFNREQNQDERRKEDIHQTEQGKSTAVWDQLWRLTQDPGNLLNTSAELKTVKDDIEALVRTQGRNNEDRDNPDERKLRKVVEALQNRRREVIKSIDQSGDERAREASAFRAQQEDQELQELMGSVARAYAKEYVSGRGRLSEELYNRRTGEFNEAVADRLRRDENFRDYWFYHILDPVIKNPRLETHRDLVSLQVIGDLEVFMDTIKDAKNNKGEPIGNAMVSHYTMLKNMIYQTHDMDYYAAHPAQDIKEFSQSTAFFTNRYIDFGFQTPMVALAKRMYEVALLQIREDHGGYIPRRYLEWTEDNRCIELDERVKKLVLDAVKNNQYYAIPKDPITGLPNRDRWMRVQQGKEQLTAAEKAAGMTEPYLYTERDLYGGENSKSTEWQRELGDLRIAAAAKMAKGLALVDLRFLEILARSKGSGANIAEQKPGQIYKFGAAGFGSVPYEGLVKHIEPIIHYYSRFQMGLRHYLPFFNMLITDNPNWSATQIKEIIQLSQSGDHEKLREKYGDALDSKLLLTDNPFSFSGMWGNMTGWRNAMSSAGWDDWEKERFSTANKLTFIGDSYIRFTDHDGNLLDSTKLNARNVDGKAHDKVQEHFLYDDTRFLGADNKTAHEVYRELRSKYRMQLLGSKDLTMIAIANDASRFERHWKQVGMGEIDPDAKKSYKDQLTDHWKGVQERHKQLTADGNRYQRELQMKLERAYKARIWVQAAMRNPIAIARELKATYSVAGHPREEVALRDKIIWDILRIDTKKFHEEREPTLEEFEDTRRITDLEGAVASMTQKAVRENRDLTEKDFLDIQDPVLQKNALDYWHAVRREMLGTDAAGNLRTGHTWYQKLGIEDAVGPEGSRSHQINWSRIENDISLKGKWKDQTIFAHDDPNFHSNLLTGKTVDRDWRYLFSTEDMGWEFLNVTALGERNPVRRAGDLGSHAAFNEGLDKLLGPGGAMGPHLNEEEFHKTMLGMWQAMAGDDGNVASDACGRIFYTTMMMYKKSDWAWKIPAFGQAVGLFKDKSIMEMIYGNRVAEAYGPNKIMQIARQAQDVGYILRSVINPFTGERDTWTDWDMEKMQKMLDATAGAAIYELASQALMIALAVTIYRALSAPSEEEEK